MPYQSIHTGQSIDEGISINANQNDRLTDLENKINNLLVKNSIKTEYIQDKAITENKLADSVKDSLSSIKIYSGVLSVSDWQDIISNTSSYSSYNNMWQVDKFSSITVNANIRTTIQNMTPSLTRYIGDGDITSSNYNSGIISQLFGDNYTGRATCYVYCANDLTYTSAFITDDEGALFVNGTHIVTTATCSSVNVSFALKKGINCIEAFWTEGTGGDGFAFTPNLSSRVGHEFLALYAIPAHTWSQTISVTCLNGNNKPTQNTLFSQGMLLNPSSMSLCETRNKINDGYVKGNTDGTVTVYYNHFSPITENITLFWYGYET